ncbi:MULTISPECIES: alpha/beta fold hydrolase [Bifidobacterium]|uniref:alpha/beta fold hydrolase n=1 Tax=Bifidobacterium TaxID=1678 RepID=UPI00298BE7A4|nr:alpha/beta hydrolase [Bifidobacterium saimiriisciurei]
MGPQNSRFQWNGTYAERMASYRFPRIPQFGPFDTPDFLRTFGIDCSIGRFTAIGSRNLDSADRVAVFIPGFTGSKEDFIPFFPTLWKALGIHEASAGHEAIDRESDAGRVDAGRSTAIVAYSQRGQADSAVPFDRRAYDLDDFVNDGCEILERLGARDRPVDLVGHSFGGVVARRVALRRPELLRSLTVFDSGAVPVRRTPLFAAAPTLIRVFGPMLLYYAYRPKLRDEPQGDRLAELFRQNMHATSRHHLASVADFMTRFDDVTDDLRRLHKGLPMNIMYGVDDDVWPTAVYGREAEALGITPAAFENAAHIPTYDRPKEFAEALVDFWRRA